MLYLFKEITRRNIVSNLIYYKVETDKNFHSLINTSTLLEYAAKNQHRTMGIADVHAMYSVMDFYTGALQEEIKSLIGIQFKIVGNQMDESVYVTMVARDYQGYLQLVKLLNTANSRNDKQVIYEEDLPDDCEHLCMTISLNEYVERNRYVFVQPLVSRLVKRTKKEYTWIELEPAFTKKERDVQTKTIEIARDLSLPLIAAPTVRCYEKEQERTLHILSEIKKKRRLMRKPITTSYFFTKEEEEKAFSLCAESIGETQRLANACQLVFPLKGTEGFERKLPDFKIDPSFEGTKKLDIMFTKPKGFSMPKDESSLRIIGYLCSLAWKGFLTYYQQHPQRKKAEYELKRELGVIIAQLFSNYFLHVQGIVGFAKKEKIPVGPGRGSAVASILSRNLNITEIDPIPYGLFFERFLNPYRLDDPDIDIDVSKRHRYRIIQHLREEYGKDHVAKISTFNPYGGKRAFESVGNYFGLARPLIDGIKELMDKKIEEALEQPKKIEMLKSTYAEKENTDKLDEALRIAQELQAIPDSRSIHTAAIVMSKYNLSDEVPLLFVHDKEMGEVMPIIQFTKDGNILEKLGYTKIDLLSLRTLDVADDTEKLAFERYGKKVEIPNLEDKAVYDLLQKGQLVGTFQLDSMMMRQTAISTKPTSIGDIVNLLALYRPGVESEIDHYIRNKNKNNRVIYDVEGQPIEGVNELEPILHRTYGIIVYQEQIMKIAEVWSGYDLGQADILRRAVSKKDEQVMKKERENFVSAATSLGRDERITHKIYDLILKFAQFGFNESHAVAYAHVAYKMIYLKAHYPLEFMSALLSSVMDRNDKAIDYLNEAKNMGINICKPSIETSREAFVPVGMKLEFGLPVIQDASQRAVEKIVEERNKRPFLSFTDFLNRMHSIDVNKKFLRALISVGTFDVFGNQNQLLEMLDNKTETMKVPNGQLLFNELEGVSYDLIEQMPEHEDITIEEKIKRQKQYIGVVMEQPKDSNKLGVYEQVVRRLNKTRQVFGGVIVDKRVIQDKNKRDMAYLTVKMGDNREETVVVFSDKFSLYEKELGFFQYVIFEGKNNRNRNQIELVRLSSIQSMKMIVPLPMEVIKMNKNDQQEWMNRFGEVIERYKGNEEVILAFRDRKKVYHATIQDELFKEIKQIVGGQSISIEKVR